MCETKAHVDLDLNVMQNLLYGKKRNQDICKMVGTQTYIENTLKLHLTSFT